MYVVFVCGGIASGKSAVARRMGKLGATRLDLDQVARDVVRPHGPVLAQIAEAFGDDLIDPETGELDRHGLAERAFATPEDTARLERIEHPAIRSELASRLDALRSASYPTRLAVVEVPLLDRALDLLPLADEVVAVVCPIDLRRERAVGRGMDADDFDRRVALQPSDAFVREHADTVIENDEGPYELEGKVDKWYERRMRKGWRPDPASRARGEGGERA
ncbi:MAG: dephospho-CoA kinase [Atopobiaceae bacterium]|jgi:dephospho-CoA kinase|nr:dephospho-CoA kinase [Atopobiaceae bacterium]MCI1318605.1 dephospho-CoA kinase [Atopobiaceae bacterium]MCI1389441.1 dephospho-CoA kinase [Atopobiaceae bacterium]MCI1432278.1 dephospho-CoA kinase [Atopobiaceae bacterium]MCI1470736.1 dephospho-CoA kinase [Atopobiaceae bacterium]